MKATMFAVAALASSLAACAPSEQAQIERGRYLVDAVGCSDCHTPGGFSSSPDMKRYLAGSDVQFEMPGVGVFVPPNLTPDKATGLGTWTQGQIVTAITTGVIPDGRILAPPMPWRSFAHLSKADAMAIATYLKSLPAVSRAVPAPAAAKPSAPGVAFTVVQWSEPPGKQ